MAYNDVIVASTPSRYWRLNEASGTSAAELMASETGTASGMTMGGFSAAGPPGIGGPSPDFAGSGHILLRSAKILGGNANFTVETWVYYMGTSTCSVYTEAKNTAGGDRIRARVEGGTNSPFGIDYSDDAASTSQTSAAIYVRGVWTLAHFVKRATAYEVWWDGALRATWTVTGPGTTWTTASVLSWLGMSPVTGDGWIGSLRDHALYTRALTGAEILAHYQAGTPTTRTLTSGTLFKPNTAVWNQRLDDPANPPTIASDSAATVTKLVNQSATFAPAANDGGGPIYIVTSAQSTQAVRILNGSGNPGGTDLYTALQTVPIPPTMTNGSSIDDEVSIYVSDTKRLYEFWHMDKTLLAPVSATMTIIGAPGPAAHTYDYLIVPALSDNTEGNYRGTTPTAVLNGSQGARLDWTAVEGAAKYRIYRSAAGWQNLSNYKLIGTVASPGLTFTDTGIADGATYAGLLTAVTSDWGCSYAGVMDNVDLNRGHFESPHTNWGASATSLPLVAGTVTLTEGMARNIPHAISGALPSVTNWQVYPAQRHDYFDQGNPIPEGTRFQLDPNYNTNLIANPFSRAVAVAIQKYGWIIRDFSSAISLAYVEDTNDTGRNFHPAMFDGKHGFEVFAGFPFSSMRVIDPQWTLSQTLAASNLIDTLADNFDAASIDTTKWAIHTGVVQSSGKARLSTVAGSYAVLQSVGGAGTTPPWTLRGSSVRFKAEQVANIGGDQSILRIASQSDTTHSKIEFWVDGTVLKATYVNNSWITTTVATATYDPAVHVWWKVAESGGTITYSTSVDGTSWTTFGTLAWADAGWPITNLDDIIVLFAFGNYNGAAGRPDFIIDQFNLDPVPTAPTPTLTVAPVSLAFSAMVGAPNPVPQTLAISNSAAGTLSWTVSEAASWLAVSPASGTDAGSVTVTPTSTGLAEGVYTTDITVTASGATGSPKTIPVTLTLTPVPVAVLSVTPLTLSFTATQDAANPAAQTVAITNTGGGSLAVTVSDDAAWLSVTPASTSAPDTLTVSPSITGLAAGTFGATITVTATTSGATGSPKTISVVLVVASVGTPPAPSAKRVKLQVLVVDSASGAYHSGYVDADELFEGLVPRNPLP